MIANNKVAARVEAAFAEILTLPNLRRVTLLGSALYLPNPTDIDIGALLSPGIYLSQYTFFLAEKGWTAHCGYFGQGPTWHSFTKNGINLLVMTDRDRLDKFTLAMRVCEGLHLTSKKDRIIVCQIIRDGAEPGEAKMIADEQMKKAYTERS